jgi:hypothetical protein
MAIVDDGLMQLPSSYDVSNPDHHAQLAREMGFRACVLRSCTSLLEDAQVIGIGVCGSYGMCICNQQYTHGMSATGYSRFVTPRGV